MVKSFVLFIYFGHLMIVVSKLSIFSITLGELGPAPYFASPPTFFFFFFFKKKREKITVYSFDDLQEQRRYRFSCLLIVVENLELVFTNHPSLLSNLKFIFKKKSSEIIGIIFVTY